MHLRRTLLKEKLLFLYEQEKLVFTYQSSDLHNRIVILSGIRGLQTIQNLYALLMFLIAMMKKFLKG